MSLSFDGTELLDGYESPEQLPAKAWNKSGWLLPFPNRLRDGRYEFEGKAYQFPINEAAKNNNLHGIFPLNYDFELRGADESQAGVWLKMGFSYLGELDYYPFPFDFEVIFSLSDGQRLEVGVSIKNLGAGNMPIGFGWHPYFRLQGMANDWQLQLPSCARVQMDDRQLPTGQRNKAVDFPPTSWTRIGSSNLDDCFVLTGDEARAEVHLSDGTRQLTFWQDAKASPFFQLFVPPTRHCIAWEPMSCNVNAFQNGEGLRTLRPNESFQGVFGVDYHRI